MTTIQACGLESAAHHHANQTVCLAILTDDLDFPWMTVKRRLRSIDNIRVVPLGLAELASLLLGTPAAEVWRAVSQLVRESSWFYSHMARLARYTWLWKYGGLVMDSDFLVLDSLLAVNGSFVAMQSLSPESGISAAVIKLTRQHPLLLDWLDRAGHVYEPEDKGAWGDQLMTAVALDFCAEELELRGGREVGRKDDLSVLESGECQSLVQVLPYSSLFPMSGNSWKEIFIAGSEEAKRVAGLVDSAKAIHLWHDRSRWFRRKTWGQRLPS